MCLFEYRVCFPFPNHLKLHKCLGLTSPSVKFERKCRAEGAQGTRSSRGQSKAKCASPARIRPLPGGSWPPAAEWRPHQLLAELSEQNREPNTLQWTTPSCHSGPSRDCFWLKWISFLKKKSNIQCEHFCHWCWQCGSKIWGRSRSGFFWNIYKKIREWTYRVHFTLSKMIYSLGIMKTKLERNEAFG